MSYFDNWIDDYVRQNAELTTVYGASDYFNDYYGFPNSECYQLPVEPVEGEEPQQKKKYYSPLSTPCPQQREFYVSKLLSCTSDFHWNSIMEWEHQRYFYGDDGKLYKSGRPWIITEHYGNRAYQRKQEALAEWKENEKMKQSQS